MKKIKGNHNRNEVVKLSLLTGNISIVVGNPIVFAKKMPEVGSKCSKFA